jgi:alpha-glucosidase (family GH31 glycosyl hydrolase)
VGRLTLAAALAALLAGCSGSAAPSPPQHGLSIRVDTSPFGLTLLRNGTPVVAEDAEHRLRYQLRSNDAQHALTKVISSHGDVYQVATDEPGRTATVTVTPGRAGYAIAVQLHPAANVQEIYDSFEAKPDEHFLGGGERGGAVDLRGQILSVEVSVECSYAPIPFFSSSAGWGLRLATQNEAALAFPGSTGGSGCQDGPESLCSFPPLPDRVEVCEQGARLDEQLYSGSLPQTLADYEADTGRPAVPPRSELELIKWRDVVNGPAQVLDDVTRLQAAQIPIGWVLLDNPWEACNGLLTFDRTRIPDPAKLIRQVHALGVEFMLWVSPKATCAQGYPPGSTLGPPQHEILDLRKPAVVAELQKRLRRLFALGVDGVKADRGDELDLQAVSPTLDNDYPLLYARAVIGAMPKGDAAIFRAATVGSQAILPGIWAGDQPGLYSGLQTALIDAQTASMSGFPTWGSDVGGYSSLQPTPETADVFERWAELGAVSPVLEVGGTGPNATPWVFGPAAMAVLRAAAVLHYELFPYLYGLLEERQPVLRPLGYGFPGDAESWSQPYELLVGPDLLAAPVTGPGTTPQVYLPPGAWVDLYTGVVVRGGGKPFIRSTPMDELPLYAREGAVIPFDLRTKTGSWWGLNELSHPGRAGFLTTNGALVDLTGQPHDVQLFVPAPFRPHHVSFAGRPVAWSWNAGPMPGVVIRMHGPSLRGRVIVS